MDTLDSFQYSKHLEPSSNEEYTMARSVILSVQKSTKIKKARTYLCLIAQG